MKIEEGTGEKEVEGLGGRVLEYILIVKSLAVVFGRREKKR